jgi:aminomethyltransferase
MRYGEKRTVRTPLFGEHEKRGARIVDFHGWEMPVWYTGIKEEHLAVRSAAGVFDASHMGEIFVCGNESVAFLERILTRDIGPMPEGKVLYGFLLNGKGGIIDDLTVYCIDPGREYMLCVNASNTEKDLEWLHSNNRDGALIEDRSGGTALIALQGPDAARILRESLGYDLDPLRRYTFSMTDTQYGKLLISKTGYTGAGGAEIFLASSHAPALWSDLTGRGALPCGLGARDTLRLEMGYPLHGNDIDESTTPFDAGLDFAVDMAKPGFIGFEALREQLSSGLTRRLWGLVITERGVPRQGCICLTDGHEAGVVSSGSISPVLGTGIALAYLARPVGENDEVDIMVRSKPLKARVKRPPFVSGTLPK